MKSPQKAILINAMGSPEIGMGHVYRSLSLARELEKEFRILFHTNNIPEVKALVREQGVRSWFDESVANIIEREEVDLLLFDQLGADNGLFDHLKDRVPYLKIVAIDYFNYDSKSVDAIINLVNHNAEKSRPAQDSVLYYEGLEYAIIREEFQNFVSKAKEIHQKVSNVLVTFGGSDPRGNTRRILQLLKISGISGLKLAVILGPLWKDGLPEVSDSYTSFHRSVPHSSMPEFIAGADLAFCGAGTTMLELLYLGTPTIVVPQNKFEKRFALSVQEKQAVKVIEVGAEQQAVDSIRGVFASSRDRQLLSQTGKLLVDGRGKQRIHLIVRHLLGEREWD